MFDITAEIRQFKTLRPASSAPCKAIILLRAVAGLTIAPDWIML